VLLFTDGARDFSFLQNVQVVFVGQKNYLLLNHLIGTPTNAYTKTFYIKTFKFAPTCFYPKIIFRKPHCSLLKSHFLKFKIAPTCFYPKIIFRKPHCSLLKSHFLKFKIAPTCFYPKIIFRELHCSLLKSHFFFKNTH